MKVKFLIWGLVFAFSGAYTQAQTPGSIDVSYGKNGKATASNGQEYDVARGMALQKDGKTVLVGYTLSDFMVARFTVNGLPDSTFGSNGVVVTDVNNNSAEQANAVIVQTDGKILVCGNTLNNTKRNFALLRYLSDGTLDNSFSGDGKLITTISIGQDEPFAIALQPDGKILLAGYSEGKFALVRYKENGMPDSSFSNDGIQTTDIDAGSAVASSVHVLKDGKILLAGYIEYNAQADCVLARYKTNGHPDSSFGSNGKVIADLGAIERIYCAVVQPDDKILVAGTYYTSDFMFGIARFNATGTLDTSFSNDGKMTASFGNSHSSKALSVALQTDGKILVAGTDNFSGWDIALLRLDSRGMPDLGFGNGGKVLTNFGLINIDEAIGIAVLPNGKIIAGGSSDGDFICVRYHSGLISGIKQELNINKAKVYPNPVNENTALTLTLTAASTVSVYITDMQGKRIAVPLDGLYLSAGSHTEMIMLPADLPAGIYCLRIVSEQQQQMIMLIKP